jgi:hypothetical protein
LRFQGSLTGNWGKTNLRITAWRRGASDFPPPTISFVYAAGEMTRGWPGAELDTLTNEDVSRALQSPAIPCHLLLDPFRQCFKGAENGDRATLDPEFCKLRVSTP